MEAKTDMSSPSELLQGGGVGPKSFIKHVFNFDDDSKNDMMNIIQYSILAIIPVVALNKSIQRFVPEVDETKGSLEILVEVAAQTIAMFIGILLIHRIIVYVPTYSKVKYNDLNVTGIVLAFLVIVLSLQTKLGEKVNILVDRVLDAYYGEKEEVDEEGKPVKKGAQQQQQQQGNPFPTPDKLTKKTEPSQVNYNSMHQPTTNPMVNAATPQSAFNPGANELMAANEALGGSFGSMY